MGAWTSPELAELFVDGAYDSVKGYVRTYVLHHQLLDHLPAAPASVLDIGGGAGHQSFPLAATGYQLTVLDSSAAMLDKARLRLDALPDEARGRVQLVEADGLAASDALEGRQFDAVLCHGVLGYLDDPEPMVDQLCRCVRPGGVVSIMTGNAAVMALRPALEQRWDDALGAFDSRTEVGVLGVQGRADTVDELSALLRRSEVEPERWYGVWLFVDLLEFGGAAPARADAATIAEVELEAAGRDPYRQLSRVFHLVGRRAG